jgi:predicted ribosome quality control (RQC) complex YloA/Tae2 family protein
MSIGHDALTLVKDVKKFEAQLAKLAKAEKSAGNAIDSANRKADEIIAEARAIEQKSKEMLADAKTRMAQAEAKEDENDALVKAAREATQNATAHEGRIGKAKAKLEQDQDTLADERAAFAEEHKIFMQKVVNFKAAAEALCKNAVG